MTFDTFLFDLDGTLVDSVADLATSINQLRDELSLGPLDLDTISGHIGDGATMLVKRSLPEGAFSPQHLQRFLNLYRNRLTDQTRVYPGIDEFLIQHQLDKMAVITNKPFDLTLALLNELGLIAFFQTLVCGDSGLPKKPDPAPVLQALRELQADPKRTVMIGDHHTDLLAGRAAGVKTCFCAFGFGNDGGVESDFRAETPEDLLRLFPAENRW
ncbi:MAG: HAD-IA family hydrolase [Syntrophotaleaceae bacterium]